MTKETPSQIIQPAFFSRIIVHHAVTQTLRFVSDALFSHCSTVKLRVNLLVSALTVFGQFSKRAVHKAGDALSYHGVTSHSNQQQQELDFEKAVYFIMAV